VSGERRRAPADLRVVLGKDEAILSFPLAGGAEALTAAESEIVVALLAGKSNRDIARARGTSQRTIANQVANVLRKLGVRSRIELAAHLGMAMRPQRRET
jgi:DNA-binding NarL/FixJ family response regulator